MLRCTATHTAIEDGTTSCIQMIHGVDCNRSRATTSVSNNLLMYERLASGRGSMALRCSCERRRHHCSQQICLKISAQEQSELHHYYCSTGGLHIPTHCTPNNLWLHVTSPLPRTGPTGARDSRHDGDVPDSATREAACSNRICSSGNCRIPSLGWQLLLAGLR
jgi:hypothetical protein